MSRSEVSRDRETNAYVTIRGTRKLHYVASVNHSSKVRVCELTCYCTYCLEQKYDRCENRQIVPAARTVVFGGENDSDV